MAEYQITLTTRDGQTVGFSCADGTDVISAAEQADIHLPSLCRDGGCGACLSHCDSGDYQLASYNPSMLPDALRLQRQVLLCRTYPDNDLNLTAPYPYAQIRFGQHQARPAVIIALETVAERTVRLVLRWQDTANLAVEFEPGQYMELAIPETGIRRAYSLANTGNWQGELEFLIRLQPNGQFSGYLSQQAAIGQVLDVYGPGGDFSLRTDNLNPALFIAGGTGLAPFLSMLRRLAEWGEDRAIHLLLGVNNECELFYLDELERLQQQIPSFSHTVCVWQPTPSWTGFCGTPADALQAYLANHPDSYAVYLCGPPLLVSAATETALAGGIAAEQIFAEKFG